MLIKRNHSEQSAAKCEWKYKICNIPTILFRPICVKRPHLSYKTWRDILGYWYNRGYLNSYLADDGKWYFNHDHLSINLTAPVILQTVAAVWYIPCTMRVARRSVCHRLAHGLAPWDGTWNHFYVPHITVISNIRRIQSENLNVSRLVL